MTSEASKSGDELTELRLAVRTRDAFLAVVAKKLARAVRALAAAPSEVARREGIAGLQGFVDELGLVAEPDLPVALRRKKTSLTALLARLCKERGARAGVAVQVRRGGSVVGRWDAARLATILGELVSNAMKYGAGHPVTIHVEVRRGLAVLVVSNVGTFGGPARSPERFRREETRAEVEGYGVGLWLVDRLARAHGGRLRYRAKDGETEARVSLPFDAASGDVGAFRIRIGEVAEARLCP